MMTPQAGMGETGQNADHPLACWCVSDGRAGMANQALGLAEALGRRRPLTITQKRIALRAPYRWLTYSMLGALALDPRAVTSQNGDDITPPWPDVLIGCGRQSLAISLGVRALSGGRTLTVQTQDPRIPANRFDLVFPAAHDGLTGPNVVPLLGAPHRVSETRLAEARAAFEDLLAPLPRPLAAVLIGGDSKHYVLDEPHFERILNALTGLARAGVGLAVTASRRTGPEKTARLRAALDPLGAYVWNGSGSNPYFGLLAHADHVLVTAESTNMVTEAAATGKPVHILSLGGGSEKFDRFHDAMARHGITRPFKGHLETWTYPPLRETDRAAELIDRMLRERDQRERSRPPVV